MQTPTDPLIGTTVAERFEILEPLGSGGMGVVYRARQVALDRPVALKTISTNGIDETFPQRFLLEAALSAKLAHSNTVRIFDFGRESDGTCFIAMEYLDGQPLRAVLDREGALDPVRALHIAMQVCGSLQEAHEVGIVHRDIKPENIMLVRQGDDEDHVKVVDFGLVKQVGVESGATLEGTMVGSPQYMAPEQVKADKAIDGRADLYALGTVLYECLTGSVPFPAQNMAQLMYAHVHAEPPDFASHKCYLPAEIEDAVMRCLAKEPEQRFATARELQEVLRRLYKDLGGTGAHAALLTTSHQAVDPGTQTTMLIGVAAIAAVAALAVMGWATAAFFAVSPVDDRVGAGRTAVAVPVAGAGRARDSDETGAAEPPEPIVGALEDVPAVASTLEPPPLRRTDTLRLDSEPSGATVFIDGRKVGVTPIEGLRLRPGERKVRMIRGGRSVERLVQVGDDTPAGFVWTVNDNQWTALR